MGADMGDLAGATQAQRALIALRQAILNGEKPGGARLMEVALAAELQTSRTPIRAALSQLAEEGLLERMAGGGFMVRSFALADVLDTIELRGILEGTAARLAAERGVPGTLLDHMQDLVRRMDACFDSNFQIIDLEQYSRMNALFHAALAQASGSMVIQREIKRISGLPFASPSAFLADHLQADTFAEGLLAARQQHKAIVEAIRNREGARAESLAREHVRAARRNVEIVFADTSAT